MTVYPHDPVRFDSGPDEPIPRIDGQIRPGLRKAFPLPASDDRFGRLLDALAAQGARTSQFDRTAGR